MNSHRAPNVDAAVKDVAAYGGNLAAVFHQYALIAERIPSGFEGATNILDATVSTLNQVSSLFKHEAEGLKNGTGKELFSIEGVLYVQRLVTECAKTLAKVEPIVDDACLPRKEFQAKVKRDKKELAKKGEPEVNISGLKLDEKDFLEKVENTNWRLAQDPIEDCMDRLYDLQLHLLLVYQVVTVGVLSKDLSTGKVDIKSIVTYHDRIVRTADLLGIEVPKGRKAPTKKTRDDSSSGSDSFSSDSDSDASSIVSLKPKKKPLRMVGPPPPPPRPIVFIEPQKRPPPRTPTPPTSVNSSSCPPPPGRPGLPWDAKPPSYSESHKPVTNGSPTSTSPSTLLGTVSQAPSSTAPTSPSTTEKSTLPPSTSYPDEKKPVETVKTEVAKETQIIKPTVHEPHLFRSKSNTFKFKIKSLFSNKEALAAEMRRALCGADSHLLAFVIQRHDMRQVPHSAFHSLEATHMKTILSQLNHNSWYQNFTSLNQVEHGALHRVLYPWADGKVHEREMVVLQVLKEESKLNAWVALLKELLNKNPFPLVSNGRILLAIVREKLVDGKSIVALHRTNMGPPPPPPPPPFIPAPVVPAIRPPPLPNTPRRTVISDLRSPPPPVPNYPPGPGGPPPRPGPFPRGPPPPPAANSPIYPPGNAPPGQRSNSIRISDTTPLTDHDAALSLTTYNEYTVRLSESIEPHVPRSWARVAITQESAERHLVQQRVQQFQRNGGNVIEAKLRLSEDQSGQVTRLMDDLKFSERDTRFEWCWVEITLYNTAGEITDFIPKGPGNIAATATLMHLVAKRMPKPHVKPLDLYNSLMRGPPAPRPTPPGPPGPPTFRPQPPPPTTTPPKKRYVSDSSDSDSDTDSSWSGSDSSVGYVRRKMRKIKARRLGHAGKGKRFYNDSDSDADSESEVEDVIKVKVEMKRGDDLVKKLLDLWTPSDDVKGKGKAAE